VLPDVAAAEAALNDLLPVRIEARHIRCLTTRDMPLGDLPEAGTLQKSDLVHGIALGPTIGDPGGALVGAAFLVAPPHGFESQAVTVLIAAVVGALFGSWASGLVAARVPNSRLAMFARDRAAGRILMMVDVPYTKLARIRALVESRHPDAAAGGVEPTIPAFR